MKNNEEMFSHLPGPSQLRDILDEVAYWASVDNSVYEKYDWDNLRLWAPEHRHAYNNIENCMNVWKDVVLVAEQVMNE